MSKFPVLFESNETEFKTHGIGVLSDAMQCDVTEQLNGIFELNMVYPASGKYLKELKNNRLIYADASKELGNQPFRICRVTKMLNGFVNVYAQHISYDLGGIQLPPFKADGISDAFGKTKLYATTHNRYTFESSVISNTEIETKTPKSVRAYLMGEKDSVLQTYGGEFTFDRFQVRHSTIRGSDKGFRVKYGVNMVDLNQEESIEKTYTGIYPYYKDEYMFMDLTESYDLMYPHDVDTSKLTGKIMYAEGTFAHQRIANVDLSPFFEIAPMDIAELEDVAKEYIKNNKIGIPRVSLDVRFENLRLSPEYASVMFLEDVCMGDTIHVDFVKLGVSSTGRINGIIYDSLRHKNKRVSVGDPKSTVSDTIVSITKSVKGSETDILGISKSVAKINIATNQNAASIELLVQTSDSGEKTVKGSVLVDAINGQSSATINADRVNLTGYVTVSSLQAGGTTEIDGSRIKTGQILSNNFVDDSLALVRYSFLSLEPDTYYFIIDENTADYYHFTTTQTIPFGGSIRFYMENGKVKTMDSSGREIETVDSTVLAYPGGKKLDLDVSVYFSETGTKIDLEKGEIVSTNFAIKNDGTAYFGGELDVNFGRIGTFDISMRGLATTKRGCGISLMDTCLYFKSDVYGNNTGGNVSFIAGDILPANLGNPHVVEIKNSKGDSLKVIPLSATLTGAWKATPYTDPTKDASEIVTKQDLIDLGLITS